MRQARSAPWRPVDRALVGVSGLRMRCALSNLTSIAEMPQNPRAEPAGRLAQLRLFGLGLVGIGKPNRPWGAGSPTPGHAVRAYPGSKADPGRPFGSPCDADCETLMRLSAPRFPASGSARSGYRAWERERGCVRTTRRVQMPLTQRRGRPIRCRRSCGTRDGRR